MKRVPLGATGIEIPELGVGVWQWGDASFWGYGREYGATDIRAAFDVCMARGLDFFDTAEAYGSGASERNLGAFVRAGGRPVVVASKFFPYPWGLRSPSILSAARASLQRLGLERIDLYQIHWPYPPRSVETWMEGMAAAVGARADPSRRCLELQRVADPPSPRRPGAARIAAGLQSGALQPARPRAAEEAGSETPTAPTQEVVVATTVARCRPSRAPARQGRPGEGAAPDSSVPSRSTATLPPDRNQMKETRGIWHVTVDGAFWGDFHKKEQALADMALAKLSLR